jgi:hypothetical protein
MALKGGRGIVVRDIGFQWVAAHPSVRYRGDSPQTMDIIVHTIEGHGKLRARIASDLWAEHAEEYADGMRSHRAAVTPVDVRALIEKALDDGWEPVAHGQWELTGPLKLTDYSVRVPG